MGDLNCWATKFIIKKYSAVESKIERLKHIWARVKMYKPGTEENKQAYLEYKNCPEVLKNKTVCAKLIGDLTHENHKTNC